MHKVMTRTQRRPANRPPTRRDTSRPGGTPPRAPGRTPLTTPGGPPPRLPGGTTRTAPADGRPPSTPAATGPTPVRPTDNRPTTPTGTPRHPLPLPQQRPTDLFAERLLAVLTGRSPVHSMLRYTLGAAYDDLADLAAHGPLRATHGLRPVVRDIGYYEPRPGAVEAFARIGTGDRLRAMAFRLEQGQDHRWRCTAVELGGPRRPHTRHD
ncbi:Rv3235 family protein [Streptomyces sp. NPDC018693]|uniref:Rv3235 family protein n=1 Tax=unclassified Streptomyces TaxID=2593676 RepID=UPI0037B48B32